MTAKFLFRASVAGLLLSFMSPLHAIEVEVPPLPPGAYEDPWLDAGYADPNDPFEGINRAIWRFNFNIFDRYLFRPVTVGYVHYVPGFAKTGINNFARNFEEPSSAVNNLLQAKPKDAGANAFRFVVNSTVGVVGLIDVAGYMGVPQKLDDFGEVLGYWGVRPGPYVMVPLIGPRSMRQLTGDVVDGLYLPLSYFNIWQGLARRGLKGLKIRADLMAQEPLLFSSLDPYIFTKEAYFQHLEWRVYDGQLPEIKEDENLEEYLDVIDY